jgi:hypothetical protein
MVVTEQHCGHDWLNFRKHRYLIVLGSFYELEQSFLWSHVLLNRLENSIFLNIIFVNTRLKRSNFIHFNDLVILKDKFILSKRACFVAEDVVKLC